MAHKELTSSTALNDILTENIKVYDSSVFYDVTFMKINAYIIIREIKKS